MMKIIHLFGANASGKSTILKELEGQLLNEGIAVLRQHDIDYLRGLYDHQLKVYYQATTDPKVLKKQTETERHQLKLKHDHMLITLGMSQTLNFLLENMDKAAVIIEGNCLPSVEALMHSVNLGQPYDPTKYPTVSSIYLKVEPETAAKRNVRRMNQYYKLSPELLKQIIGRNADYQRDQIMRYDQLAAHLESKVVFSTDSIENSANLVRQAILEIAKPKTEEEEEEE